MISNRHFESWPAQRLNDAQNVLDIITHTGLTHTIDRTILMVPLGGAQSRLKLFRSLWGVVIQESQTLDQLLATISGTGDAGSNGGGGGSAMPPVRSKIIPSTLDHKLFPSRQARKDYKGV